ncbi:1139_t:CDS:2 [Diversispora eburnea]|uniref:1139_t:CDS:1 n=1 Tax=Diversispora eburnea TaxID=1213867 RepID=A0A9N9FEQ4_9GLOM|nr:1139_t:CDS:2 [Diversispora eburnea]
MNGERKEFNKYCGLIMFEPPSQPLNQSISAGCLKIKNEKRPPRPPNAFILYRREKQPAILATNRHMTNAEISRYIANLWKNESNETRLMWERYADQQKLNHMKAYPNYVYRPNKSRNEKRRQQRRKQRKATAGSNNNNNDDDVDDTSAGSNITTPDISTPIPLFL